MIKINIPGCCIYFMALWCVYSFLHLGVSSLWEVQIFMWVFKFSKHWLKVMGGLLVKSSGVLEQWVLSLVGVCFFLASLGWPAEVPPRLSWRLHLPRGPDVLADPWFLFSQVLNSSLWPGYVVMLVTSGVVLFPNDWQVASFEILFLISLSTSSPGADCNITNDNCW